jgi:hypothetical protein
MGRGLVRVDGESYNAGLAAMGGEV